MEEIELSHIKAAVILFILTLIMGTLPVHLLEWTSRYLKKKRHSITLAQSDSNEETSMKKSKWSKWFQHDRIVQFLTQIGGGVLFYTAFVHMLPEIRENYEKYQNNINNSTEASKLTNFLIVRDGDDDDSGGDELPLVDLCACAGLFGIFLLEEIMHALLGNDLHGHSHSHNHSPTTRFSPIRTGSKRGSLRFSSIRQCIEPKQSKYNLHIDDEGTLGVQHEQQINTTSFQHVPYKKTSGLLETHPISSQHQCYNTCEQHTTSSCDHQHRKQTSELTNLSFVTQIDSPASSQRNDIENSPDNEQITANVKHSIWPHVIENFLLILAFSCHSIFDGISIGVQSSENEIWTMLIAILSHKLLIAFILAFQIYERCHYKIVDGPDHQIQQKPIKGAKWILWFFSTLFALMSPLGIVIVMKMSDSSHPSESSLNIIVLAAISAGTILYIVFFEIVDKSTSRLNISGIVQWAALVIGFAAMHFIAQAFPV